MQTRRRLLVVLAAVSIVAALITGGTGCSKGSTQSGAPLPDATTLVKQSTDVTKNLKSAHLVLSVIGKIPGLPIKTLTGDLTTSPATAASGDVQLTMGGSEVDANFVVVDGELYATLTPNKWSDFGKAADIYDVSTILNPDTGVANVLANFNNPKAEGRETINGQSTIRISGTVPADAVNKIASQLSAGNSTPATVWIQETGDHQLVQSKLDKSSGNSVQMTLSNWNQPVQVTKPQVS
jgi:lipoprotein LprG